MNNFGILSYRKFLSKCSLMISKKVDNGYHFSNFYILDTYRWEIPNYYYMKNISGCFPSHKICEKWGKSVTLLICVSHFMRFKKFLKETDTGYNICIFSYLQFKRSWKKWKLDHGKNYRICSILLTQNLNHVKIHVIYKTCAWSVLS